jgi:hypothetical protein
MYSPGMPALKPVPGVLKIHHGMTVGGDTSTGFHLYASYGPAPPSQANLDALCAQVVSGYSTFLAPHAHLDTILTSVTATDLSSPSAAIASLATSAPGGLGGDTLPASLAMLVNFRIHRRYRGGKPRVYVPTGAGGDLATPQTWASTFLTAFQTSWNNHITTILTSINSFGTGAGIVNVSYYLDGQWKPTTSGGYVRIPTPRDVPVVDPIIAQTCSNVVGQQRRRVRPR